MVKIPFPVSVPPEGGNGRRQFDFVTGYSDGGKTFVFRGGRFICARRPAPPRAFGIRLARAAGLFLLRCAQRWEQ